MIHGPGSPRQKLPKIHQVAIFLLGLQFFSLWVCDNFSHVAFCDFDERTIQHWNNRRGFHYTLCIPSTISWNAGVFYSYYKYLSSCSPGKRRDKYSHTTANVFPEVSACHSCPCPTHAGIYQMHDSLRCPSRGRQQGQGKRKQPSKTSHSYMFVRLRCRYLWLYFTHSPSPSSIYSTERNELEKQRKHKRLVSWHISFQCNFQLPAIWQHFACTTQVYFHSTLWMLTLARYPIYIQASLIQLFLEPVRSSDSVYTSTHVHTYTRAERWNRQRPPSKGALKWTTCMISLTHSCT